MSHTPAVRLAPHILAALLTAALFADNPASAQQPGHGSPAGMQQMPMKAMPEHPASGNPLMQAMDNMNRAMGAAPMTGAVDHDFVAMMIPHHQGAIDMAQVELTSGKDPSIRKLARRIIDAQQREIREMRAWQAKHPPQ